jgi:hypothetical protein
LCICTYNRIGFPIAGGLLQDVVLGLGFGLGFDKRTLSIEVVHIIFWVLVIFALINDSACLKVKFTWLSLGQGLSGVGLILR